ncbi:MAG: addiction module antidote protein [Nitrospirales bacterium]
MPKSKSYQPKLLEALKDPDEAAEYLNVALEEGDREVFLLALRNVANARGGITKLAEATNLNRENLYRMLSEKGNPELYSLYSLLDALGFRLAVGLKPDEPKQHHLATEAELFLVLHTRKVVIPQTGESLALAADTKVEQAEKTIVVNSEEKEIGELKYDFQRGDLFLDNIVRSLLPKWASIDVEVRTKDGIQHQATTALGSAPKLTLLLETPVKREEIDQITLKPHHSNNKV